MKKVSLLSTLGQALGVVPKAPDHQLPDLTPEQKAELRVYVQKAMAADQVENMCTKNQFSAVEATECLYLIRLKFTWEWPIPVALEVRVVDENTWNLELVNEHKNL